MATQNARLSLKAINNNYYQRLVPIDRRGYRLYIMFLRDS
jgi:hypothetical protein